MTNLKEIKANYRIIEESKLYNISGEYLCYLIFEYERLEAKNKELEDQKKFWKDTYTHNHMGTVRQIKEGKP